MWENVVQIWVDKQWHGWSTLQNEPTTLALHARESHPATTGTHIVDLFSVKTVHWESHPAINTYRAYDDYHPNDRAIRCNSHPHLVRKCCPLESNMQLLTQAYPLLRHGNEKAAWRLVDCFGCEVADSPSKGEGSFDFMGCIVPCSPYAVLHRCMVKARHPDKGVQHWKLRFGAWCIQADDHLREKRTVSQKLARSIHRYQHLMNGCAESKASLLAVADDDRL